MEEESDYNDLHLLKIYTESESDEIGQTHFAQWHSPLPLDFGCVRWSTGQAIGLERDSVFLY